LGDDRTPLPVRSAKRRNAANGHDVTKYSSGLVTLEIAYPLKASHFRFFIRSDSQPNTHFSMVAVVSASPSMKPMMAGLTPSALGQVQRQHLDCHLAAEIGQHRNEAKDKDVLAQPEELTLRLVVLISTSALTSLMLSIQHSSHLIHVTTVTVYVTLHGVKRGMQMVGCANRVV